MTEYKDWNYYVCDFFCNPISCHMKPKAALRARPRKGTILCLDGAAADALGAVEPQFQAKKEARLAGLRNWSEHAPKSKRPGRRRKDQEGNGEVFIDTQKLGEPSVKAAA